MAVSKRLKKIIETVTPGYTVADIGTDHGYVPISLLRENKCTAAIGIDSSKGSVEKAVQNAERARVSDSAEFRHSDGLESLAPGEAECIVITGMGGILMTKIMNERPEVVRAAKELVLSPQRDIDLVIETVKEFGFEIKSDEEIEDKGRLYRVLRAEKI